jgi:NAD+ synthase
VSADLRIEPGETAAEIENFISSQIARASAAGAVLGLSGGLDSTVTAYLTVRALGPDRVYPFILPYHTSSEETLADARLVAKKLGLAVAVLDVTPQIDAYFEAIGDQTPLRLGNKVARERMSILYDQAKARGALVVGTGNRSERLLGYATLWGDMACDLAPLGGLFKTQVQQLAVHLRVPQRIIEKPPTADLWPGQTDEAELGISYQEADPLLHLLVDRRLAVPDILALGCDAAEVKRLRRLLRASAHKRRLPPSPSPPPLVRGKG